jgi:cellulose synthase/poly-beta-1,6-N-acetylglucosamine synthase-like glycosyltransferase
MLLSLFLTCFVALVIGTAALLLLGHRVRIASRLAGLGLTVMIVVGSGEIAAGLWSLPSRYVLTGEGVILAFGVVVVFARPVWNPVGQVFFATFLASATTYLWFAAETTLDPGLSVMAHMASAVLFLFEVIALVLSASFTFESCDAVCRTRSSRPRPRFDPEHLPMVSLQLATYNEPPDMLISTIQSLEALDYPRFEIVVIDNNTKDPEVWQPVEEYCRDRELVRFVHVDPWPGFKSGALNLALSSHTHPDAEVIGIVDADYLIEPGWLRSVVGHFTDPEVAFVQTPQDYREYERDGYLQACYDAYKYFFVTSMPSRHERNSIIFAGTMGLVRRSVLEEVGGWDEWCITEDAELSLRMLMAGHQGVFVPQSYGHGIMPLTFSALKSQRFRWCFGGMQILRKHWRNLAPWNRDPDNKLTAAQRVDYLLGSLQWTNDLVYFGFTLVLLASAVVLIGEGPLGLRPLYSAAVLLPTALVVTGVVRALWALRVKTGIGLKRAVLAFLNWLSLSWTVALACVQGLVRSEGVFLRTPKEGERNRLLAALWSARAELCWALLLWVAAALAAIHGRATLFVLILFAWQGLVYASAPFMSWLNQHTELSAQLERRRRSESLRERSTIRTRFYVGALSGTAAAVGIGVLLALGGSNPGAPGDPFATPERAPGDSGPIGQLVQDVQQAPAPSDEPTTTTSGDGATTTTSPGVATTDAPTTTDSSSTDSSSTTTVESTTTTSP